MEMDLKQPAAASLCIYTASKNIRAMKLQDFSAYHCKSRILSVKTTSQASMAQPNSWASTCQGWQQCHLEKALNLTSCFVVAESNQLQLLTVLAAARQPESLLLIGLVIDFERTDCNGLGHWFCSTMGFVSFSWLLETFGSSRISEGNALRTPVYATLPSPFDLSIFSVD